MKAIDLCPPKHLCAADLDGNDVTVTIEKYDFAEVGKEKDRKGVLKFKEFPRTMVLNRTNLGRIIDHHGKDADKWIGLTVTLYESEAQNGDKIVPCIRVRAKAVG